MPQNDQASTLILLSYIDSKHEDSEPIIYASYDQYISFMWLHTRDWFFFFTYNIVRTIHTATVACFLWLLDVVCMASLYCAYKHKLHMWYALTNMKMCFVWSLIATHPITILSNSNYVVNLHTCWGIMYFHFTFMLVLDSWLLEEEDIEPYQPLKSLPGYKTETTTWKV